MVRDLREAATSDSKLIDLIEGALDSVSETDYLSAIAVLMIEWGKSSGYQSAAVDAAAAGYGLILSEPSDEQERGWMDIAIKANEQTRNAFRATLTATDLQKFDNMRDRMIGGLEKIFSYEAFTGYTFLHWNRLLSDATNYVAIPAPGGRPVETWVPLTQILEQNQIAVLSSQVGYLRVNDPSATNRYSSRRFAMGSFVG